MAWYFSEYYVILEATSDFFQYSLTTCVCFFWTLIILITCFEWELVSILVCLQKNCELSDMGVMKSHFNQVVETGLIWKYVALNLVNLSFHLARIIVPAILLKSPTEDISKMLIRCDYCSIAYFSVLTVFTAYTLHKVVSVTHAYMRDAYLAYRCSFYSIASVFAICLAENITVDLLCAGRRHEPGFCTPYTGWSWIISLTVYLLPAVVLIIIQKPRDFL